MMNTTSNNSDNPSGNPEIFIYCYVGLSLGFLILITSIPFFSHYCSCRNLQSRGNGSSNNSNSNRTVILMERRDTSVTIEVCDDEEEERDAIVNGYPLLLHSQVKLDHKPDSTSLIICSICLGDYKDSEWLRLLPHCGHFFHKECIDTWLRLKLSCPMCRNSPLPTPLAEVTPLAT